MPPLSRTVLAPNRGSSVREVISNEVTVLPVGRLVTSERIMRRRVTSETETYIRESQELKFLLISKTPTPYYNRT